MIYLLGKTVLHGRPAKSSSSNLRSFSNKSLVVSYLVNSCGFSPEKAAGAAKYVHLKTPKQADSVIAFLKDRGFSETQIFTIIRKRPDMLQVSNPHKILLPKFDFFYSKGISSHQLATILSCYPDILRRSLEKQLAPSFDFLANMLKSNEDTFAAIKRYGGILCTDLKARMIPNINMLRQNGVPDSSILTCLKRYPITFFKDSVQLKEHLEEVKQIGFSPLKLKFVLAIHALTSMSETTWVKKVDCYKKWGWSDEDIIQAFKSYPFCMKLSEKKIEETMNYVTTVMGLDPSLISKRPILLAMSLKKRIVPRGSVGKVLLSKGLIEERKLARFFGDTEQLFLEKFVRPYEKEAPKLLKLYKQKLDLSKKPEREVKEVGFGYIPR